LIGRGLPAGVIKRLACGAHRVEDEFVDLALLLRLHPLIGIEGAVAAVAARNLSGDLARQVGDVEAFDPPRPALPLDQPAPCGFDAARQRRDHAEPCDHDPPHLRSSLDSTDYMAPTLRGTMGGPSYARRNSETIMAGFQLFAFFSRNFTASPTVRMVSAASSGISQPNSSSKAMTSSTVSTLSAPR